MTNIKKTDKKPPSLTVLPQIVQTVQKRPLVVEILNSSNINSCKVSYELTKELRSSVFMLGALVSRVKKAVICYPGGCDIGLRPIDIHLKGLKKFLLDFSLMPEKEYFEVHIWEEYLIFAQLLGIADKVEEQFSKLYPQFKEQTRLNTDVTTIAIRNRNLYK